MPRIVAISDTHMMEKKITKYLPEGDILINAGDITGNGKQHMFKSYGEWAKKLDYKHHIVVLGNHDCCDKYTELLTKRGWVDYKDIKKDDLVLSIGSSDQAEWTGINNIIIKQSEFIYKFKSITFDMAITENHRICYNKQKDKIKKTDKHLIYDTIENLPFNTIIPTAKNKLGEDLNIHDDFIRLLGWILTDGGAPRIGTYHIYQSKLDGINKIVSVLNSLDYVFKDKKRIRDIKFICGKKLKSVLESHEFTIKEKENSEISKFIGVGKKVIKEEFDKLSARQLRILLETMMDGDGSWNSNGKRMSGALNKTKEFLDWVQTLAVQCGVRASLIEYRKGHFRLNLAFNSKSTMQSRIKDRVEKEIYNDAVWCLEVPNLNFMVRRNGKAYFTGNCLPNQSIDFARELLGDRIIVLHNQEINIDGIRYFGTSDQPFFMGWEFNRSSEELKESYSKIPIGIDVLITHCPPYGILDLTMRGTRIGSMELRSELDRINPKIHIFGHAHSGHGSYENKYYNCSLLDDNYDIKFKPQVIDI